MLVKMAAKNINDNEVCSLFWGYKDLVNFLMMSILCKVAFEMCVRNTALASIF